MWHISIYDRLREYKARGHCCEKHEVIPVSLQTSL
jgi:hypothetical protein